MLKRKENKSSDKKGQLMKVGSLFILLGISILSFKLIDNLLTEKKEDKALTNFYINKEKIVEVPTNEPIEELVEKVKDKPKTNNYIAVLKISKIGLEKGLASKDSYNNNVNRNIQILDESDLPDKEKGNLILAGHSGNGRTAYFKNLYKLEKDDLVSVFYNSYEYKYKVVNLYDIEKTGTAHIIRNLEKNTLTLITCRHNTNKQIVIICELIEKI